MSPSKVAFVEKEKGKEKATIPKEAASPSTPLEKLQQRMNSSSGPCWYFLASSLGGVSF